VIRGIERRSDMVVLPAQNTLVAKAPGFFRKVAEKLGFRSTDIVEAIALAERKGQASTGALTPAPASRTIS
jgi:hypothetical protein